MKATIAIEINTDRLTTYTDTHLAMLWHVAQANPAPIEDKTAGELAEHVGREIIRRFLSTTSPELWSHQGEHHYWNTLQKHGNWTGENGEWKPTVESGKDGGK